MNTGIKAIIFDVDGVLIDPVPAYLEYHNRALANFGVRPITPEEFKNRYEYSLNDFLFNILKDQALTNQVVETMKNRLVPYPNEIIKCAENTKEVLIKFKSQGFKLGIVTNKIKMGLNNVNVLKDILPLFDSITTIDDVTEPKPNPEGILKCLDNLKISKSEAVYIGDAKSDEETAINAEIKYIKFDINTDKDLTKLISLLS